MDEIITNAAPTGSSNINTRFWTACHACRFKYEHLIFYLNKNLRCPNCHEPFVAVEIQAAPINSQRTSFPWPTFREQKTKKPDIILALPAGSGSGKRGRHKKKRNVDEHKSNTKVSVNHMAIQGGAGSIKRNGSRDLSNAGNRDMLVRRAKLEIQKKLNEWNNAAKGAINDLNNDRNMSKESLVTKPRKYSCPATTGIDFMSVSAQDSEFYSFDKDRTEESFGKNQVWAAYDDTDGMPRLYAVIHNVTKTPFNMQISWLNSRNLVGCRFYETGGDFWVGKKEELGNSLNSFSHRIKWTKGRDEVIQIFPRRGDVWAIYRNWSPDWNELTPIEVIEKYDVVEVVEDCNEEQGVTIVPLVKVSGFKSVFHQHLDPKEVKPIPKQEMFRFSHQVPSYLLTGQEAVNAPKGCWELDPAALPSELLQVIT